MENGAATYYLRSSVLGGQVIAEVSGGDVWLRGFVYDGGGQLLALQQSGTVQWTHQDPVTKSQRVTDTIGGLAAGIDLDPFGMETSRSWNSYVQPRKYTTYERDGNGSDEAMMRRYNRWHQRFDQPDPYDGSYNLSDPQSFNRYSYTQNDPVNFVDPSGLDDEIYDPGEVIRINVRGNPWQWGGGGGLSTGFPAYELGIDAIGIDVGGGPQGPTGPVVDSSDLGDPPFANCIARAIRGGRIGNTRNIAPSSSAGNGHDGIHVEVGPGTHPVTALPAMAGRVLHAGRQSNDPYDAGYRYSVVDILLNTRINGQQYVMTLKDMGYDTGIKSGSVRPGRTIGSVEGSANPVGETGLHVTLMPYSTYRRHIDGRFTSRSRYSVPINQLMDAARDPASPFRCP